MPSSETDAPAIVCDDLSVARRRVGGRVVDGVSFTLEHGATRAIMGPTGSGKSSLAALLAGADVGVSVSGGRATVTGIDVRARGAAARLRSYRTGYVAQRSGAELSSRNTIAEVISEPVTSRDKRVSRTALAQRVATLLDELHLPLGVAAKYPYELSSGMRQRVALARALVLDPVVLIGDEMFAGIDVEVKPAVLDALVRRMDAGTALLLVTNDAALVDELDAEILVLRDGFPVALGRTSAGLVWTPDGNSHSLV